MAVQLDETLSHIHELNLLLNSNMADAMQAANDSKQAIHGITKELAALNHDTEKGRVLAKEEAAAQLRQLETSLNNQLLSLSDKTLLKLEGDRQASSRLAQENYKTIMGTLNEQLEQMTKAFRIISAENIGLQKESVARIGAIIEANAEISKSNQVKLAEKLAELNKALTAANETLTFNHEAMLGKLDEQTRFLRKSQRKWFIWLLIAVIIGYFF